MYKGNTVICKDNLVNEHAKQIIEAKKGPFKLCTVRRIFIELWVQHIRTRQVREQRRLRPRLPNAASRNLTTITKEKRALGAQGV